MATSASTHLNRLHMRAHRGVDVCGQTIRFKHDASDPLTIEIQIGGRCSVLGQQGHFKISGPIRVWGVLRMRSSVKDVAVRLWKDERGASLLEYSILIGLITVGVVATVTNVGTWISGRWTALYNALVPPA